MSLLVKLDPHTPDDQALEKAITCIITGKTIAFPTETFYALGASAYSEAAIEKVFTLKGRDYSMPLPLIIEGDDMLREVAAEIPAIARSLIQAFWPGGLTLILRPHQKSLQSSPLTPAP